MSKTFKLGTRGSLLAYTQSTLIKNELEEKTGHRFELVKITTQGDLNTSVPLWQMDGKDFFTKELDEALLRNEIDLVVHSYKDLGSVRPAGIQLAAITKRTFANDILLIKKSTQAKLGAFKTLKIGTSSPRRIYHIEKNLGEFLPGLQTECQIKCEMLRGNVNTRISKLQKGDYDAIILAFAGLERLASHPDSLKELKALVQDLDFMVLPQSHFTSAPSQGALAIECRQNDKALLEILSCIHNKNTAEAVTIEKECFQSFGGGCHLAMGIYVKNLTFDQYIIQQGIHGEKEYFEKKLQKNSLTTKIKPIKKQNVFLGLPKAKSNRESFLYDEVILKKPFQAKLKNDQAYFITTNYALESMDKIEGFKFVAGTKTWQAMIQAGHWIHGSADSLGHDEINELKHSRFLKLFYENREWFVLTNKDSKSEIGKTIACYEREILKPKSDYLAKLEQIRVFYWTSFAQYQAFLPFLTKTESIHCCGLGKTLDEFKQNNVNVLPVADMSEFTQFFLP
ncbi:MAG: hydroxymethylbilane synthase [Bacteriovoracaceae bacterium]|nr:hydroxymethylbilane synthase [Bacteriovoracaceae bacterium]